MARTHMTDEGPKKCEAEKKDCPVKFEGGPAPHFDSVQEYETWEADRSGGVLGGAVTRRSPKPTARELAEQAHQEAFEVERSARDNVELAKDGVDMARLDLATHDEEHGDSDDFDAHEERAALVDEVERAQDHLSDMQEELEQAKQGLAQATETLGKLDENEKPAVPAAPPRNHVFEDRERRLETNKKREEKNLRAIQKRRTLADGHLADLSAQHQAAAPGSPQAAALRADIKAARQEALELRDRAQFMERNIAAHSKNLETIRRAQEEPYGLGKTYEIPATTDPATPAVTVTNLDDMGTHMLVSGYRDGDKGKMGSWTVSKRVLGVGAGDSEDLGAMRDSFAAGDASRVDGHELMDAYLELSQRPSLDKPEDVELGGP